jgi:light-regulated signal transduction histidine kinase (bacteriophytochrome)/CheY-like chemotaxis protein
MSDSRELHSETETTRPDPSLCEREPINVPGAIQPHGALLAADFESGLVTHASANLGDILGRPAAGALGRPLKEVIGEAANTLLDSSAYAAGSSKVAAFGDRRTSGARQDGGFLHLQAHRLGRLVCIDIEPMIRKRRPSPHLTIAQSVLDTFSEATTRAELCELAVRGLKALTGYDRIMAYRFHEDGHGEVIAEARAAQLEPFLGLHYPATDIPPQARRLYLRQRVGEIPDSSYQPVPLLADPLLDDAALDLTHSALRSVSPIHLEYMRNMKTAASLRISLTHGEHLWGLLVCHNSAPWLAGPEVRAAADMIGQVVSLVLGSLGEAEVYAQRLERNDTLRTLVEWLASPLSLPKALAKAEKELLRLADAAGAVVRVSGAFLRLGRTPPRAAALRALAKLQAGASELLAVDDLVTRFPELADCATKGSGAMLLRLASGLDDAILWFRPALSQTINWAGDPAAHATLNSATGRLHPRASFAAFSETASGRSAPWAEADLALARALGRAIEAEVAQRTKVELVRKSKFLEITLEHMSQGLLMVDTGGLVQVLNDQAMKIFGTPNALMAGPPHFDNVLRQIWDNHRSVGLDIPESQEDFVRVRRMSDQSQTYEANTLTGAVMEVRSTPLPGGGGVRTYTDVTRQKHDEAMLRVARDKADEASRAKSEFLATMSHEIRSPLSGLVGVIELLRETNLDPDQDQMAGMAHRSAISLLAVLNDILDFSKIEAGALSIVPEPVHVRDLVSDLVQPYLFAASRKGVSLTLRISSDAPDRAMTDPLRLRQILNNLLSNAIKFTANGEIELCVDVMLDAAASRLGFAVRDSGIGMTAEVISRLFEPFVQADSSTTRDFGGTGLGLCISQRLAGLLDGTLTVTSRLGEGSVFTLLLPLTTAYEWDAPVVAATHLEPESLAGGGRVLVVDDDSTLRWLSRRQLEQLGLSVDVAENGEMALEMLHSRPYALLLTDCHMPRMDGVALTRLVRASPDSAISGLPIIGLTADVTSTQRERCREAGMNDVAIKPLTRGKLSLLLSPYLRGSGAGGTVAAAAPLIEAGESVLFDDEMYRDLFPVGDPEGPAWLEDYLKAAEGFSAEIQQVLSVQPETLLDRDALAASAHSLAGTSLTVGAKRLGAAARTLEYAAADEGLVTLREQRLLVCGELATARRIISAYIAGGDSGAAGASAYATPIAVVGKP